MFHVYSPVRKQKHATLNDVSVFFCRNTYFLKKEGLLWNYTTISKVEKCFQHDEENRFLLRYIT